MHCLATPTTVNKGMGPLLKERMLVGNRSGCKEVESIKGGLKVTNRAEQQRQPSQEYEPPLLFRQVTSFRSLARSQTGTGGHGHPVYIGRRD